MWKEVVEKTVNAEAKTSLQLPSGTREIYSKCPKSYRPSAKKGKDEVTREYWHGNKAKFHNPCSTNTSQPQTQAFKNDKRNQGIR